MDFKLYAVRIFVADFDRACAFYGDTLGLECSFRSDEFGWAEFDVGGPRLGIERVAPDDAHGNALIGRFVGLSLQVDDIAEVYRRLGAAGVNFTAPPERQDWGGTLAQFTDPDGNELTLLG